MEVVANFLSLTNKGRLLAPLRKNFPEVSNYEVSPEIFRLWNSTGFGDQ